MIVLLLAIATWFNYDSGITWNRQSMVQVSAQDPARYCGYARMRILPNGDYYCVYESAGSIVGVRSKDRGATWSNRTVIAARQPGCNMAVPELLVLNSGDILVLYNPRPNGKDTALHFGIRACRSTDQGEHFTEDQLLYEAGTQFVNGCWEPAAIQLPDGKLQLFFANEGPYTHSEEQEITMMTSTDDGHHWQLQPQPVSFRARYRDGMPVPVLDPATRQTIVAIEDNGKGNFKPMLVESESGYQFSKTASAQSTRRKQPLARALADTVYAGAPYLARTGNGRWLLSYQGTEYRNNKMEFAEMKVTVSNTRRSFGPASAPFPLPAHSSGLWNSLLVENEHEVIALTSTNAFSSDGSVQVWMIRGRF